MVTNWATSFSHYRNRGFRWLFWCSDISLCFFCFQLFPNFLQIAFFKKGGKNKVFSIFSVLSLNFENSLFLGLLKHYKNRVSAIFWGFLLLREKKIGQKYDNWNLWILVFWSKNGSFVTHICFSTKKCLKPCFYSVFWVRAFWAKVSKKVKFEKPARKKENSDW